MDSSEELSQHSDSDVDDDELGEPLFGEEDFNDCSSDSNSEAEEGAGEQHPIYQQPLPEGT